MPSGADRMTGILRSQTKRELTTDTLSVFGLMVVGFGIGSRDFPRHGSKYKARMPDEDDLRVLEDTELKFVPVSIHQLARAVTQVESCEKCNPDAEIPFDWVPAHKFPI
jgi:hypothetical protein